MEFEFKISLHKDDLPALQVIQAKLGIGKIDTYGKMSSFRVNKYKDLLILFDIFTKFPLNSTKYLNYLDFKQAFELYFCNSKSDATIDHINKLLNRMNTKRAVFSMPKDHIIRITPNWLLEKIFFFIKKFFLFRLRRNRFYALRTLRVLGCLELRSKLEGDGSFSVKKVSPFELSYTLSQKNNTALLKAIQTFFNNLYVNNSSPDLIIKERGISKVAFDKRIASKGEITNFSISQENFITFVLIPFFDSLHWYTKKEEDYIDWKYVLELKKLGLHYVEKGIRVINLILSQMNLNRLSTNSAKLSPCLQAKLKEDIYELLSGASNLEVKNGKTWIKSLNRYYTVVERIKVNILDKNGLLLYSFDSTSKCAKFLGISGHTVRRRLVDNKPVIVGSKEFFISKSRNIPSKIE